MQLRPKWYGMLYVALKQTELNKMIEKNTLVKTHKLNCT